ncbi:MAG: hypothetical protein HUU16_11525 [Candidatus Omnitrophica bacterium]|nr:hypothetical protein [Candidatus Omnitrophota bacterium]
MKNLKNALVNLSLLLGSVILTLLAMEGVFRLLDVRGTHAPRIYSWDHALVPKEERLPGVQIQFKPHVEMEMRYDSNPRGAFNEHNTLVFHTNNFGFRGPDFTEAKPPGTRRVILLGDSFTFAEGVNWEDSFPNRLAALLSPPDSTPTEVLPVATSAWNTLDEIHYLEHQGLKFQPDLVLVIFVANDAEYAGGMDLWENYWRRHESPLLRFSYLASSVYNVVQRRIDGRRYIDALVNYGLGFKPEWERCRDALLKGRDLAQGAGANYAVVIFPFMYDLSETHPFLAVYRMIEEHCEANNIPVWSLLPDFMGWDYSDLWVHPTDQHPNEIGHRIAAESLERFLREEQLLGPRRKSP